MNRPISNFYMKGIIIKDNQILLEVPKTKLSSIFQIPTVMSSKSLSKTSLEEAFMGRTGARCEITKQLGSIITELNSHITYYILDFKKMEPNAILSLDVNCSDWVDLNKINEPGVLEDYMIKALLNDYIEKNAFENSEKKINEVIDKKIKDKRADDEITAKSYEGSGIVY